MVRSPVMSETVTRLRKATVERALHGPGKASGDARRAAFDNAGSNPLIAKVAKQAWTVTDADIAAAKQAGLSEDEIFELVVCVAYGQATRQLEAALAAVDAADKKKAGAA
jgi:hypothetical protein